MEAAGAKMSWRESFGAWWKFWGEGRGATRDMGQLNRILPGRVRSVEGWIVGNGYRGAKRGTVLKNIGDSLERGAKEKDGMGKGEDKKGEAVRGG